jgi:hypothetical protein
MVLVYLFMAYSMMCQYPGQYSNKLQDENRTGKDAEKCIYGLIRGTTPAFVWRD